MTTLVTGASGHIGGNLVRALLSQGRKVRVLVRKDQRAIEGLDLEKFSGDILDPQGLKLAMQGVDCVYHLASIITIAGDPDGMVERTNVQGARNVVQACLDRGVKRLVHFSSIHAFCADPVDRVIDETRPLTEVSKMVYDRTKAAGQREILSGVERGLNAVILHPTAVIGPHDYKLSRMGEVILKLCQRKMPALVPGGFNWVDVRDVVAGAMAAESQGRSGESYLLSGTWCSVQELAELVSQISGKRPPRFTSPMWLAKLGAPFVELSCKLLHKRPLYTRDSLYTLNHHKHVSHDKATQELRYRPRPLKDTVRDTIEWFKNTGMLRVEK